MPRIREHRLLYEHYADKDVALRQRTAFKEGSSSEHFTASRVMASNCCQVCTCIPWEDLPSETDAGIPHHASYAALKISAQECSLCSLLVKAAEYVRERVDGKYRGRLFGGWATFITVDGPVGRKVAMQSQGGIYSAGTDGTVGIFPPNDEMWKTKPAFPFLPDTEVRPWLYGGWFYTHPHKEKLQLLGVGVRLGKKADLIEGEGNGKVSMQKHGEEQKEFETVDCYLHGTPLRISTIDGRWKASYYVT